MLNLIREIKQELLQDQKYYQMLDEYEKVEETFNRNCEEKILSQEEIITIYKSKLEQLKVKYEDIQEFAKKKEEDQNYIVGKYHISAFTFDELKELFILSSEHGLDIGCHIPTGTLDFNLSI